MTKNKCPFKTKDVVLPRGFIPGFPIGLTPDTRCVVREVKAWAKRLKVDREDGRATDIWVDFDAVRKYGEPG